MDRNYKFKSRKSLNLSVISSVTCYMLQINVNVIYKNKE